MMSFISVPLIVGISCFSVYGLFELFVRRKERLAIIEKIADKWDTPVIEEKKRLLGYSYPFSFSSLKVGCLLTGVGIGLLVGFLLNVLLVDSGRYIDRWYVDELGGVTYGASTLLFGGLALVVAFLVELKLSKEKE